MHALKRLVREDDGFEMLEWAVVAALFATAGAIIPLRFATGLGVLFLVSSLGAALLLHAPRFARSDADSPPNRKQ